MIYFLMYICSYNKTEGDFKSLRDYNDYLEEVETISGYLWLEKKIIIMVT